MISNFQARCDHVRNSGTTIMRVTHHSPIDLRLLSMTKEVLGPEGNLLLLLKYVDVISISIPNLYDYTNRQGFYSSLISQASLCNKSGGECGNQRRHKMVKLKDS